jgi:hypothetical protein
MGSSKVGVTARDPARGASGSTGTISSPFVISAALGLRIEKIATATTCLQTVFLYIASGQPRIVLEIRNSGHSAALIKEARITISEIQTELPREPVYEPMR